MDLVNVAPKNPPHIVALYLDTFDAAVGLLNWAANEPGYYCTVIAHADDRKTLRIGGPTSDIGMDVPVGQGYWIVFDFETFEAMTSDEFHSRYNIV